MATVPDNARVRWSDWPTNAGAQWRAAGETRLASLMLSTDPWNPPRQIGNKLTWVPPRRRSGMAHRSYLNPRPRLANRPDALLPENWPGGLPQSARFLLFREVCPTGSRSSQAMNRLQALALALAALVAFGCFTLTHLRELAEESTASTT